MISIIVAASRNNVIGKHNDLPWSLPNDLKFFRETTSGKPVIMGRKTFDSIVGRIGKPLPNRQNIVVSRSLVAGEGYEVARSLDEAIRLANGEEVFVIGGAQIFEEAVPKADRVYLTRVEADVDGDTFFPELVTDEWRESKREEHKADSDHTYPYTFLTYDRVKKPGSYNFQAARSEAQAKNMEELAAEGRCFMCHENLITYERNRIDFETEHWIVTPNAYPYEHTSLHLLLIARRHVTTISELTKAERADLMGVIVEAEKHYKLDSYAVGIRSGDFRWNGASVEHLHAHIVVGERDIKKFAKVRFKMSSHPDAD